MQPSEQISILQKQVSILQSELQQKDAIIQEKDVVIRKQGSILKTVCDTLKDAIPFLQKVKGWFFVGKKIKKWLDVIIALPTVVCPIINPDGQ